MFIFRDENNVIKGYSNTRKGAEDVGVIYNIQNGTAEETEEELVAFEDRFFLKSEWEDFKGSEEYTLKKAQEEAQTEIQELKKTLADNDYKIIKMAEASLLGEETPYNTEEIIAERNRMRSRINELETYFS